MLSIVTKIQVFPHKKKVGNDGTKTKRSFKKQTQAAKTVKTSNSAIHFTDTKNTKSENVKCDFSGFLVHSSTLYLPKCGVIAIEFLTASIIL